MTNECRNRVIIKGEASSMIRACIDVTLKTAPTIYGPEWRSASEVYFITASTPPIEQVQSLQREFPEMMIELDFTEIDNGCGAAVLSNGNIREDLLYIDRDWCWHNLGWRLWDPTGKELLDSETIEVPRLRRMSDRATYRNGRQSVTFECVAQCKSEPDDSPF